MSTIVNEKTPWDILKVKNLWYIWNIRCEQVKTQSNIHQILRNCNHIFTHKCKKVKLKPFQWLSNHHDVRYWIYNMLYTKFEIFYCINSRSKIFLKLTSGIMFKIFLH
jgi:hypothetical protein